MRVIMNLWHIVLTQLTDLKEVNSYNELEGGNVGAR